jgi:hypothetical protein
MTSQTFLSALRAGIRPLRRRSPLRDGLAVVAIATAVAVVFGIALAPPRPPSVEQQLDAYISANAQKLEVPEYEAVAPVPRDAYSATPGIETLAAGGTNYDWAKLVLLQGGWPMTDSNVTVILRWMRQENGPDNWFNRNNPLNNGWGSGGGGGTGSYDNLIIAAENAAEALHSLAGYAPIVEGLAASADTAVIENAIWNSPWASGHYHYGGHWSYAEVPMITAPAGSWG